MKRKFFTSLAAAGILACTIATASAAPAPMCAQSLNRNFCCWQNPCCENHVQDQDCPPVLPDTPIVPEAPVLPEEPNTPEIPEEVPDNNASGTISQLEQAACDLINRQRAAYGLAPLTISTDLSVKARIKSEDMKTNKYFSHNSPTYGSPFQMMKALGITYQSAGENIAMGYSTAEAVVKAWMNSESHRANILSDRYTSMGIGFVDGYWTQWFIG